MPAGAGQMTEERTPDPPSDDGRQGANGAHGTAPLEGADLARRRFFRQFAGEVVRGAATMTGAAGAFQRSLTESSWASLDPASVAGETGVANPANADPAQARAAFRIDGDRLFVIDQRRLPGELVEYPIATSADAVRAMRELVIRGAPATSQIAAICLALTAGSISDMHAAYARKATLRSSGDALISAHPSAVSVRWAVGRCLGLPEVIGDAGDDGSAAAAAIRAEAGRIVLEGAKDHRRLAAFGFDLLERPEGRPLNLLTHGSAGWLAGGQYGTALGIVDVAVLRGQPVHVYLTETRPALEGARLAAWELAEASVDHTILTDAATGWLLAMRNDIDAVIVGAETIAANGDTVNTIGTYPLAAMAAEHGIPVYVCAPLCSVDLRAEDGMRIATELRSPVEVTGIRGIPATPSSSKALNPASDVTPARLITAIVTEEGVLRPEFGPSLMSAIAAREARWLDADASPGTSPPAATMPDR
jgi:methylthioribose-1-phosphate isomerase